MLTEAGRRVLYAVYKVASFPSWPNIAHSPYRRLAAAADIRPTTDDVTSDAHTLQEAQHTLQHTRLLFISKHGTK